MDKVAENIIQRVVAHYTSSKTPLLLSQLGKALRVEGLWPVEGETRSLREVVDDLSPDVKVFRDPRALAYVVVVPNGSESIAETAISSRLNSIFLNNLPRSVVLAFVVHAPDKQSVFLLTRSPFRYHVGVEKPPEDGFVLVDSRYRMDGEFVDKISDLSPDRQKTLANNIRSWATANDVTLDVFYDREPKSTAHSAPLVETKGAARKTALERLISAQPADVAARLVVPADIAVLLSRIA